MSPRRPVSTRRAVIGGCLVAFVVAGTGSALADGVDRHPRNELCVVLAQDDDGNVTKDLCVTWPGPTQ